MAGTNYQEMNYSAVPAYQNPYYPTAVPSYPSQISSSGITWVQGESGAKAYPVAPGNTVLLMDSESSVFYIKSTDASGIPQPLRTFDYSERIEAKAEEVANANYVTRDEFDELKKLIDDLTK